MFKTYDVVGLYSNIPHRYGLKAIEYWLDKFPESLYPKFPKEFALESVKFILESNLKFDNDYFNQIKEVQQWVPSLLQPTQI